MHKVVNFSLKAKPLKIKSEGGNIVSVLFIFFTGVLILISTPNIHAQVENTVKSPGGILPVKADSLLRKADTLKNKNDTLSVKADTLKTPPQKGDIETTIFYSARDSINSSMVTKIIKLYGEAKIKYGEIELEAEQIVIDYEKSTISANGILDSLGQKVGFPIFKNGAEVYETHNMVYNFKTKRARISSVVTQQGDGFMAGETVYKNDKNELFSINNAYTTCNLEHPHFRIISKRSKAIPSDKVVSGPFYMEFNGVPTPFGFPFGMFPSPKHSTSGILFPTYGEERRRGFFLRGGGYYFDISDYVKLAISGDIYSKGGSALYINSNYKKRYKYGGSFNFSFTNNKTSDKIEDESGVKDFRLTWSHSPQTKGTGRFSSSVNIASATYNNNNYLGVNTNQGSMRLDNTTRKLSSNISYAKTFAGTPFSMGINLRHSQDISTKQVDLPLPDVSFNMNNIYPFKKVKNNPFLENVSLRWTMNGTNFITNNLGKIGSNPSVDSIAPFKPQNFATFLENSRKGVRHNIPLATSFKVLKQFTISPSFSYDELWYFEKLDWGLSDDGNSAVIKDTISGFNRVVNYSTSVGVNTRLYGMFLFKKGSIKAIRHVINPSVSYSYQPDFGDPKFDYYQQIKTNNGSTLHQSRHQGFIYGSSRLGKSNSLGFSLGNSVEMKYKSEKDTVAKKIALLNNLSASAGYNLAADSFKLSNISLSANTNVLQDKININVNATLDPYEYVIVSVDEKTGAITDRRSSQYAWKNGFDLGQITNANLAFSTNLNPKGLKKDAESRDKISKSGMTEAEKNFYLKNPDAYVDFDIPWNLRVSYNFDYAKPGHQKSKITQTLRFSGDLSLSKKWKAVFNSGYDFQQKQFTQTNISMNRELHCWQMSVNWVPFGKFQSYSFSIGVKSGMLRDMKLDRNRSFFDTF